MKSVAIFTIAAFLVGGFFVGNFASADASATIWTVDASGDNTCTIATSTCATVQGAVNAATAGDTIILKSDMTISSQVTINKALIIDGENHTLFAPFIRVDNSNNSAIGIQSSDVTVKNLTIDGNGGSSFWKSQLHGINTYLSNNVLINNVTILKFGGAGMIINGSNVTATN